MKEYFWTKIRGVSAQGQYLKCYQVNNFAFHYPYHQMGGLSNKLRIKTQLSYLMADKDKCYKVATMVFCISFLHIFNLFFAHFLFFFGIFLWGNKKSQTTTVTILRDIVTTSWSADHIGFLLLNIYLVGLTSWFCVLFYIARSGLLQLPMVKIKQRVK